MTVGHHLHRRLRRLELAGADDDAVCGPMIDRPPVETRDQWLARRQAGMHWAIDQVSDAWVMQPNGH